MTAPKTRGTRLRDELLAKQHRPGPTADASPAEVAHLAVLRTVDHLVTMALLETFVTPVELALPARRLLAIVRHLQDAVLEDTRTGTTAALEALYDQLYSEETQ